MSTKNPFKYSNSKITLGRRCGKAYEYKYIRKLIKRVKDKNLQVGTLIHNCVEHWHTQGSYTPAIREWRESEFKKMFAEEQALMADVIPLVKALMRGYIRHWNSLDFETLWVEKEFNVETAPGLLLNGFIDGRVRQGRRQFLVERKTCKKMPDEEVRIYNTQGVLYFKVLPLMGEDPVDGIIWDYVRKKIPTKPLLLKGGTSLSVAKSIDTTREVFEREIKRHGFDMAGYKDILEHLDSRTDSFYRQITLPFNKTHAETVWEESIFTAFMLKEMEDRHNQGEKVFFRNLGMNCSWCNYRSLCLAEMRGEDTEYLLKHDYVEKDDGKEKKVSGNPGKRKARK